MATQKTIFRIQRHERYQHGRILDASLYFTLERLKKKTIFGEKWEYITDEFGSTAFFITEDEAREVASKLQDTKMEGGWINTIIDTLDFSKSKANSSNDDDYPIK